MKGKSKYIVPLLLAGVTASAGVVTTFNQQQQTTVQAETTTEITDINGAELKLIGGFEDIYKLGGNPIYMPEVQCTDGYTYEYTIYRGSKVIDTIKSSEVATKTFTPKYTGAYNVVITAKKDNAVVSEMKGLTIMVEKDDAVIKLPVNSEYVIPAQVPVSNSLGLKIPAPTVVVTDPTTGEDVEETATQAGLKVYLVAPNSDEGVLLSLDSNNKYYHVTSQQLANAGTYQIRYEYYEATGNTLVSRLETNFQVVNNLKTPTDLYLKLSGNVPSTGNVNTEISVPKVTVLDSKTSTDGINAHVVVTVSRVASNGEVLWTGEIDDYENYTFTPKEEGNYEISYKADLYNVYSGVSSTLYKPTTVIKVQDKANPTVMPTFSYNVDEDGKVISVDTNKDGSFENLEPADKVEEILVNRKVDIPSVAVRGSDGKARFKLPAIYGTDNKDGYNNLELTREIVGNNISKITVQADDNKESEEIVLNQTGNYEIRYIATDKAGNRVRATYSLVVKDAADVEDGETTLNLSIGVSSISDGETLKFSAPTAKDTHDSNIDIVVGYRVLYYDNTIQTPEYKEISGSEVVLDKTNDDGKYEVKIADIVNKYKDTATPAAKVRVFAKATVDKTLESYRDSIVTEETRDVTIVDTSKDTAPATISIDGKTAEASTWNEALLKLNIANALEELQDIDDKSTQNEEDDELVVATGAEIKADGYAYINNAVLESNGGEKLSAFNQGNGSIILPDVKFVDVDENLRLTLTIQDRFGNSVSKDNYGTIEKIDNKDGTWSFIMHDASFRLSASGIYTVTYRAEDTAGHVVVKSFGIRVNDKTAPTIVIDDEDKFGVDVEVGEFFEVPVGTLYKDGKVQKGQPVTWQLTCSGGAYAEVSSTGFTPLTEGTYYISYYGIDSYDNDQILQDNSLFYVNAVDTTDPVFNDDSTYTMTPTMNWTQGEDEMEVAIPRVHATDPIKNESLDVVYTVKSPDGSKVTVYDKDEASDVRYFKATKQGIYTIEFEATDSAKNSVKMTKEISIGDCKAPEITWENDADIPTEKTLGDTWELPLSNLTITDDVTTEQDYLENNMTITLLKPDGTTAVTNEGTAGKNYIWTFSETGTYTLRIVVKDEAGQSRTYKYNITVAEEAVEDKVVVSSVVGTVLIVVSVVILAGVVIYFVVSSRKKAPKRAPKSKKKD